MNRDIVVVNKDNEIIKNYMDARTKLLAEYDNLFEKGDVPLDLFSNGMDSVLLTYDKKILKKNLSKKAYRTISGSDPSCLIVEHEWVFFNDDGRYWNIKSFQTKEQLDLYVKEFIAQSIEDYEMTEEEIRKEFDIIQVKEISGNLESNLEFLEEKNCKGFVSFIKVDYVYSDNIIIGFSEL